MKQKSISIKSQRTKLSSQKGQYQPSRKKAQAGTVVSDTATKPKIGTAVGTSVGNLVKDIPVIGSLATSIQSTANSQLQRIADNKRQSTPRRKHGGRVKPKKKC